MRRHARSLSLLLVIALGGCASSVHWRGAAISLSAVDVATTGYLLDRGGREANPIFGSDPTTARIAAVSAAALAVAWWLSRDWPEERRMKLWQTVTWLRLLPVAWNTYQIQTLR